MHPDFWSTFGFQAQDNTHLINNRQAGRRRGRGGQQQRSQGGAPGRPDNGNRIDNRARGNAAQLLEKYKTLARDAQMQGDRVNVEYYLQFADHYFRVLAETRARFEENGGQSTGRRPQGATLDDDETDFEDEGERVAPGEQQGGGYRQDERGGNERGNGSYNGNASGGSYAQRDDRGQRDDRSQRDERGPREERAPREDRGGNRMNAHRDGGSQSGEDRDAEQPRAYQREERAPREDRTPREERAPAPREERNAAPREERAAALREERAPAPRSDPAPYPASEASAEAAPADPPKRGRGRPRRDATPVATPSASDDAPGFDADRLPPSLGLSAIVPDDADTDATEEKPRRRRGRPPANVAVLDAE